jgi:uncharacterized protein DUF1707
MRTSDAERQHVSEFLRDACADGRLTPEELEDRLDALFASRTVGDLAALVRDLPGGASVIPGRRIRATTRRPAPPPLPVRRARGLPAAAPVGALLLVVAVGGLAFAALPPLIAIVFAAVALSIAIAVGVIAIALAPVGLALFGIAWLLNRIFRGGAGPRGWGGAGPRGWPGRGRHPFL